MPTSGSTSGSAIDAAKNRFTLSKSVTFLGNVLFTPTANYHFVTSNPTSYALVYSCTDSALGKIENAYILSKAKTLDDATIATLKTELNKLSSTLYLRLTPVTQTCDN